MGLEERALVRPWDQLACRYAWSGTSEAARCCELLFTAAGLSAAAFRCAADGRLVVQWRKRGHRAVTRQYVGRDSRVHEGRRTAALGWSSHGSRSRRDVTSVARSLLAKCGGGIRCLLVRAAVARLGLMVEWTVLGVDCGTLGLLVRAALVCRGVGASKFVSFFVGYCLLAASVEYSRSLCHGS